jgi:hypothetical protein
MFIVSWLFDKLGYMPKIDVEVGVVKSEFKAVWPFPEEVVIEKPTVKKPAVKKTTARKPAVKKAK